jgi:MFS family permease
MSPILGKGVANWGGAILLAAAAAGAFHAWPLIGALKPWQVAIIMPGLIGLPMALLLFAFREPARRHSAGVQGDGEEAPTFRELLAHVSRHRKAYIPIYLAMFLAAVSNGFASWLPAAIGRSWGLAPTEIGRVLGPLGLLTGPVTLLVFGYLMDRFGKSSPGGAMRVALYGTALHLIPSLCIFLAPSVPLMWTAVGVSMLFDSATLLATSVALTFVTPTRLMGKATAFYAIAANSGSAIGPTLFALIGKFFFTGKSALPHALLVGYPVVMVLTMLMLWIGGRVLVQVKAENPAL